MSRLQFTAVIQQTIPALQQTWDSQGFPIHRWSPICGIIPYINQRGNWTLAPVKLSRWYLVPWILSMFSSESRLRSKRNEDLDIDSTVPIFILVPWYSCIYKPIKKKKKLPSTVIQARAVHGQAIEDRSNCILHLRIPRLKLLDWRYCPHRKYVY